MKGTEGAENVHESCASAQPGLERRERDVVLLQAFQHLASSLDLKEALHATIEEGARIVDGEGCSVWLVDKHDTNKVVCEATHAQDGRVTVGESCYSGLKRPDGKHDGLTGWVFANGKPLRIANIRDQSELARISSDLEWSDKYHGWASQPPQHRDEVRPFLAVPMLSARRTGDVIGVIRISTTRDRRPFTEEHECVLTLFATLLSPIISNARRREEEVALLSSLFETGVVPPDFDQLLEHAVARFPALFAGSHASVLLGDKDGRFHIRVTKLTPR